MTAHGLPEPIVDILLSMCARTVGHSALVTTEVERILDRPASTFATWVTDHVDAFGG
ncbi:hypothetical protein [Streptosporangium sp. NPDC087985]|uniref:hypothetical protein n=1 Tax=Streptosporangium sp. NPDC087985 TaxID=3366196 RepID=UPI00382F9BA4